jgi:protein involved in polysaccharide export with SLBB domain
VRRLEEQVEALAGQVTTAPYVPGPVPLRDPTATLRAGDVLDIRIAGEHSLPRRYLVESADGTIRFPLLGPLRVVGLTIAQVRELIARMLAERELEGGRVTVELYRLN